MNLLAPISSIMTTDLVTVNPNDSMKKVEEIFNQHKIHHLPVLEDDKLVGMVSKSDYNFFKRGFINDNTDARLDVFRLKVWKVSKVMTTGLAKMDINDRINVALKVFEENLFHAILITKKEKLVGIVTTYDIIKRITEDKSVINSYLL